ncbi:LpqB family beta-propeller domain-containing protein [Micrococcoides hystricis]|uniref:LpqB family beta-propeller domain-containing protein n=1 Tax=Micrococcoides hystricis TaxID=1572761 RepID=A0ABV6P8C6_9MICC
MRGTVFAFLNRERTQLYTINENRSLAAAVTGQELTWPTIDNSGWVWTVSNAASTPLISAVPVHEVDGVTRNVNASWLADRNVLSFKISADGARAAIVASDEDGNNLYIAGVIRDSEGVPRGLTNPTTLQTEGDVNFVNWASETKVVAADVGGAERVTAEIVGLDGKNEALRPLLGMTNLSTGPGEDSVYAETDETVYLRVGSSWRAQETEVSDLNYPG